MSDRNEQQNSRNMYTDDAPNAGTSYYGYWPYPTMQPPVMGAPLSATAPPAWPHAVPYCWPAQPLAMMPPPMGYGWPPYHDGHRSYYPPGGPAMSMPPYPPMGYAPNGEPPPAPDSDWTAQAEGMVDQFMGEQAGMFKNIMKTIGMDDKDFWKGALVGAAAALILGNEQVRSALLKTVASLGSKAKAGSEKIKEHTSQVETQTAPNQPIFNDVPSHAATSGTAACGPFDLDPTLTPNLDER